MPDIPALDGLSAERHATLLLRVCCQRLLPADAADTLMRAQEYGALERYVYAIYASATLRHC